MGPVWRGGDANEEELLAACYQASLKLAESHGLRAIAFPAISCGVYRFPVRQASEIAVRQIRQHLAQTRVLDTVTLVAFDDAMEAAMSDAVKLEPA